jgi:WD40 repeat protein
MHVYECVFMPDPWCWRLGVSGCRWFATAARDQTVKVWGFSPGSDPTLALTLPPLPAAATAVAFAPSSSAASAEQTQQQLLLAVGLESGHVQVWAVAAQAEAGAGAAAAGATCLWQSPDHVRLAAAVRRLQWMDPGAQGALPACGGSDSSLRLAACGDDHSVRVFAVTCS